MTTAEKNGVQRPESQVTITGRNVDVPEQFTERVNTKLAKIEKLDPSLTFFHVELQHEKNPARGDLTERLQITATGAGHVARAEAKEESFQKALESAISKLERSLRKVKVRRKVSRSGHRAPKGTGEVAAQLEAEAKAEVEAKAKAAENAQSEFDEDPYADQVEDQEPGQIVRTKEHEATPISVDQALSEMELVGHDFYLFLNEENDRPSVVYRRHAFDYGLISLVPQESAD